MPIEGDFQAIGRWRSQYINYPWKANGSPTSPYQYFTWSGSQPDADAEIIGAILLSGTSPSYLISGITTAQLPYFLGSETQLTSGQSIIVEFELRRIASSPTVFDFSVSYNPTPIGDRKGAKTIERSGGTFG